MDVKKEKQKMKMFFILQIIFVVLTWILAILVITKVIKSAIYAIIAMTISLIFGHFYQKQKKLLMKKGIKLK